MGRPWGWSFLHLLLLAGPATSLGLGGPAGTSPEAHTLLSFRTAISQPGMGLTHYWEVVHLDGRPIERYDSHMGRKMVPVVPWMSQSVQVAERYWDLQATLASLRQEAIGDYLLILQNYFLGQSPGGVKEASLCSSSEFECGDRACLPWHYICDWFLDCQDGKDEDSAVCTPQGFHTLQCIDGCELGADGQERPFHREAYDGREITAWEPTWDLYRHRMSLWGGNCTWWLKRHVPFLQAEQLQRKEAPDVRVTRVAASENLEMLLCQAYGFHPKEINLSWTKDGQPLPGDALHGGALCPNSDGTYQARLGIQVDPKERAHFRCHVEHAGLQEALEVAWKGAGSQGPLVGGILGAVVVILLAVGTVCCLRTWLSASKALSEPAPAANEAPECSKGIECEGFPPKQLEEFKLLEMGEPTTISGHEPSNPERTGQPPPPPPP
ncbi:hypothetical protein JRQ81_013023 [Phrynocephalus forsythii]|uniref:Ig-like domain-containing protein n=1 Tax=Phrynocephalus forsythii TaxID=171643 RepID=A0A9Q0XZD1_9SAUR|nr:hypothetical protein JRQ81_013023 [Phrynocephalus forsythii]